MPRRKKILLDLPDEVREELDRRLIENHFSGYVELSEWLDGLGYSISKSTAHKYGQELEERINQLQRATEQAKIIAESVGDDENAMGEALSRLAQHKAFEVLMHASGDPEKISFPALCRAIADLNRSSISVKQYRAEVKKRAKDAAEKIKQQAKQGGLSNEALEIIDKTIFEIVQ